MKMGGMCKAEWSPLLGAVVVRLLLCEEKAARSLRKSCQKLGRFIRVEHNSIIYPSG